MALEGPIESRKGVTEASSAVAGVTQQLWSECQWQHDMVRQRCESMSLQVPCACPSLAGRYMIMRKAHYILGVLFTGLGCASDRGDIESRTTAGMSASLSPLAVIQVVGVDTLSDSASIHRLQPEPDGGSIAFLFADPVKGIIGGLGLIEASGAQAARLVWPDSVTAFWWSGAHQLSFTSGTGQGVRVVVDAHAAQLSALEVTGTQASRLQQQTDTRGSLAAVLSRAQAFIDSVRIQPGGTPQGSALRYEADSIVLAPGDTFAAVHVRAADIRGTKVNPTWYLTHVPSGHMQGLDSLTGRSVGLPASAGQWGADGRFYYAKERSIWRADPKAQ